MLRIFAFASSLFVALCLLVSQPALAQTTTGTIVGVVTDPSGNTVPGAEVTVTNEETGIAVIQMTTDSSGNYVATALPPSRYSVSVKSTGFKVFVSAGIIVSVQDRIAVNVPMEVGQLSETVEVVGAAQALQTDSSYLGQVVDSQRIVDLPLNGRFFTQLALLTSGTLPTVPSARDAATGGFSSNGIRPYQNSFLLDGIDNNSLSEDLTNQASYVYGPSPDAIAEFKVQTNSMSAEFGRSGGAVMNVNIKSGTNGYHGSAFEFLRNQALDARNFFAGNVNPKYRQNQFGGAVGGPVRKNRIFFFADYQGTDQRIGDTFVASVAPVAWHTGNFSGFHPILDPTTKQPIPNNQVPASAIDPVAAKLTSMMVNPNATGSTSAIGVANNYVSNPVQPARTDQGDIRIDYQARPQDALFGRFSMSDQNLSVPVSIPAPLGGPQAWTNNSRSAVLGETHIFSAHVINEARIGYTRLRSERLQYDASGNVAQQIGLPGIPFFPENGGLPNFTVTGITTFGAAGFKPSKEVSNLVHLIETLSVIKGRHTLKFGAEYKPKVSYSILQPAYSRGQFNFTGNFTRDPNNQATTGLGFADFLLGKIDNTRVNNDVTDTFQQPGYFFYAQDDFKVNSKLTLNLGIRYEFVSKPTEAHNAIANFNIANGDLQLVSGRNDPLPSNFFPQVPVTRDSPRQLVPQSNNDWAPRVGFAYQVTSKTVVRSGFGVFYTSYEPGPLSIPNPGNNPPFYLSSLWAAPAFGVPNPLVNQLSQGLPANAFVLPAAPALFAVDPGLRNPYVLHWNFTVQRSLPWGMVWETGYAGSSGNHLYEFDDANQPAPTADPSSPINARRPRPFLGGSLTYWCSCDHSSYHSLVTKVEKRLSNNLSFLAAYTWGKSIDEVSQASLSFANDGAIRNQNDRSAEKAVSGYDIAQRFVMSFTYELPFARNLTSRPAKLLLDGWQVLGIDSFATGIHFTVDETTNFSNAGGDTRPDVVPGVSIVPPGGGDVQRWFNAAAFRNPALGYWGNVGRNTGTMPSTVNVDFSVFKNFRLAERKQLQFRAEVFNLPNYVNFTTITKVFDAPDHGALTASSAARQVQFALKLLF